MEPVRKGALLWGLIGALSFGALYQGYVLTGPAFDWRTLVGGMAVVGAATTHLAPRVERRLLAVRE